MTWRSFATRPQLQPAHDGLRRNEQDVGDAQRPPKGPDLVGLAAMPLREALGLRPRREAPSVNWEAGTPRCKSNPHH
jgi:hypothetical protein